jgi:hypothetical protein
VTGRWPRFGVRPLRVDPLLDPRCLVDTEAVALDGADGVCRAPRLGAGRGLGPETLLVLVVGLLSLAWFLRERAALPARRIALVLTLVVGAIPGTYAVLTVRADRPGRVDASARALTRLHDQIRAFATARPCAWVRTESCVACVATAQLALVGHTCTGETTEAPIDLFSDALDVGCAEVDGALRCGTVDDDAAIEGGVPMLDDPFAEEPAP